MGGPLNMSVDHLVGNNGSQLLNMQEQFVVIYNFLNTQFTRIASNYGISTGGLDATGFDFFDAGSGHAGHQSWAIFRTNGNDIPQYNIAIEWRVGSGGDWTLEGSGSNDGVGIGAAIIDTGADTWTGGTADAGADATADPRWSIGAGSELFTFNYENEAPAGTQFTNKEDLLRASGTLNANTDRALFHLWADDDAFLIVYDDDLDGSIAQTYIGNYDLVAGATQVDGIPVVAASGQNLRWFTMGGGTGDFGTGSTQEGGGLLPPRGKASGDVPGFFFDSFLDITENTAYQPNRQLDVPAHSMPRHALISRSGSLLGHVGYLPNWIRYSVGLPINARNDTTPDRAFFGSAITTDRGVLPWHTGGPPGANASRAGIQAVWNGP